MRKRKSPATEVAELFWYTLKDLNHQQSLLPESVEIKLYVR